MGGGEEERGGGEGRGGERDRERLHDFIAQSNLCLTYGMLIRSTTSGCRGSTDSFYHLQW